MFYSENDFEFETQIGLDYISQDMNQTVLVFQVDKTKSQTDDLYGENIDSNSIEYKDPVEINVVLKLDEAVNKSFDKTQGVARYLLTGNLKFGVYTKTLTDNKIDIMNGLRIRNAIGTEAVAD